MSTRIEQDSMGTMEVPAQALYGAQTRRAELNFPVSGWPMPLPLVHALARLKRAAATVNRDLGLLDEKLAMLIVDAATEAMDGELDEHFIVDVFQTGSGTSTNMNVNEVVANRACLLGGGTLGSREPVHPNDHVNLGQSSNDIVPSALHVSAAVAIARDLLPALGLVVQSLRERAKAFDEIVTIGRTHLQDATPVRLGQVFGGYAAQMEQARAAVEAGLAEIYPLPVGGTAVGTGINTHPEFGARVAAVIASETGLAFTEASDHMSANAARSGVVSVMAALKRAALDLAKVANDIRFLASGPRCGLGELTLPAVQPGSSIMPGKVNPVICESVMQVSAYVVGADAAVSHAAATLSNFELCVAVPLMANQTLESVRLLANVSRLFSVAALDGLDANRDACEGLIERSLAMCTRLAPAIGYDNAANLAKEAFATGRTVREVALEQKVLPEGELNALLDPDSMTRPAP